MSRWIVIVFCVILLSIETCLPNAVQENYDEEHLADILLNFLTDNPDVILKFAVEHLSNDGLPKRFQENLQKLKSKEPAPFNQQRCDTCMTVVDAINTVIDLGNDFEDINDTLVALCEETREDPREEIICPGIIGIQGPVVFNIFRDREIESDFACVTMNACSEDQTEPDPNNHQIRTPKSRSTKTDKLTSNPEPIDLSGAVRILQITDAHVDIQYLEGSATDCGLPICCRSYYPGDGAAGGWGDYNCNTPPRTARHMFDAARNINPHYVVYTGDSPPNSPWNQTEETQIRESRYLANELKTRFTGIPIYPVIGNHENFPTNLYKVTEPTTQRLNNEVINLYRDTAGFDEENTRTIQAGGYYTKLVRPGLRLLVFNTNYIYTTNFYILHTINDPEYNNMKTWMRSTLQAARNNNEKVLLVGHHPVGERSSTVDFGQHYTDLYLEYSDIIITSIHGHKHDDQYKIVIPPGDGQTAVGTQFVMSSLTPKTDKNPAFRVYYLHNTTFHLLDYDNYFLNLTEEGNPAPVRKMYGCREEYGLQDMSPAAFQQLANRLEADDALFRRFYWNRSGRSGLERDCGTSCKYRFMCGIRNTNYNNTRECERNEPIEPFMFNDF